VRLQRVAQNITTRIERTCFERNGRQQKLFANAEAGLLCNQKMVTLFLTHTRLTPDRYCVCGTSSNNSRCPMCSGCRRSRATLPAGTFVQWSGLENRLPATPVKMSYAQWIRCKMSYAQWIRCKMSYAQWIRCKMSHAQ